MCNTRRNADAVRPGASAALLQDANRLFELGQSQHASGDLPEALLSFQRCKETAEQLQDPRQRMRSIANAVGSIGSVLMLLDDDDRAEAHLNEAIGISRELGNSVEVGWHVGNLANLYWMQSRNQEALEMHKEALSLSRAAGDRFNEAAGLASVGCVHLQLGDHEQAECHLRQSISLTQELTAAADPRAQLARAGLASNYSHLSNALTALGRLREAVEQASLGLALSRELGHERLEAFALGRLATAHERLGQYDEASQLSTKALAICKACGDRAGEAENCGRLAGLMLHAEDYDQARKHATRGLAVACARGDQGTSTAASIHVILGTIATASGALADGEVHFEKARPILERIGDHSSEAMALLGMGKHRLQAGRSEAAIPLLQRASALNLQTGELQAEAETLRALADAFESVQKVFPASGISPEASLMRDEFASDAFERVVAEASKLARFSKKGTLSVREIRTSARLILPGDIKKRATTLGEVGSDHERENRHDRALECFKLSLGAFDRLWEQLDNDGDRIKFGNTFIDVARSCQRLLLRLRRGVEALECAEHWRSRSLEVLMVQQRIAASSASSQAASSAVPGGPPTSRHCGIEQIVDLAKRRQVAVIVYSVISDDTIVAWVVTKGGTKLGVYDSKPDGTSLAELVQRTRRQLIAEGKRHVRTRDLTPLDDAEPAPRAAEQASRAVESADDLLRQCHQLLIAKFASSIQDEELLIVPSECLHAVPFAALVDEQGARLIEHHAISVAPSIGVLLELEERAAATDRAARATIVGDPTFYDPKLQLPGARLEANEVSKRLSANSIASVTHLSGDAASKEAVREAMQDSEYVHMATHGFSTGLLLAGSTKSAGLLSMGEVQGLSMRRSKLVVLSACDTFQGELSSDGLLGIARAFMAAGAPTLIASLWPIHDRATRELMSRFYDLYFGAAKRRAPVALRGAMLSMLRDERFHAFQWAAFVVFGLDREMAMENDEDAELAAAIALSLS